MLHPCVAVVVRHAVGAAAVELRRVAGAEQRRWGNFRFGIAWQSAINHRGRREPHPTAHTVYTYGDIRSSPKSR